MELHLVDELSPLLRCQLPYELFFALARKMPDQLTAFCIDPHDEEYAGYADEEKRIAMATELFPVIVEAMLPQAIVQDEEEEETCLIDFTAHGTITFNGKGPNDWVGEAKSLIGNLACIDPQVKNLTMHRVDIYS